MIINTKYRSKEEEWMDDFHLEGAVLEKTLRDIAKINKWLGGNKITINGVIDLLKYKSKDKKYKIIDIGCGNGDMLRMLADYAIQQGYDFELIGVDANQFTIDQANLLSKNYTNITFYCENIFEEPYINRTYDILLCTLTLHHFTNTEIKKILTNGIQQSAIGIVINDLHRSALAYYLFIVVCFFFLRNPMAKNDGLISILKGFKRKELKAWSIAFKEYKHDIKWKWAFRYQWLIKK